VTQLGEQPGRVELDAFPLERPVPVGELPHARESGHEFCHADRTGKRRAAVAVCHPDVSGARGVDGDGMREVADLMICAMRQPEAVHTDDRHPARAGREPRHARGRVGEAQFADLQREPVDESGPEIQWCYPDVAERCVRVRAPRVAPSIAEDDPVEAQAGHRVRVAGRVAVARGHQRSAARVGHRAIIARLLSRRARPPAGALPRPAARCPHRWGYRAARR